MSLTGLHVLKRYVLGLLALTSFTFSPVLYAQVSISVPATTTRVAACDDLATNLYADPWDMNNSDDINNYISGDVRAVVFGQRQHERRRNEPFVASDTFRRAEEYVVTGFGAD
jgi:hypothetical protein